MTPLPVAHFTTRELPLACTCTCSTATYADEQMQVAITLDLYAQLGRPAAVHLTITAPPADGSRP